MANIHVRDHGEGDVRDCYFREVDSGWNRAGTLDGVRDKFRPYRTH